MRRLLPLFALLAVGCGSSTGGDRGEPAATADLGKPPSQATMESMPPEARAAAENSMKAGAAMKAKMDAQFGGKH